MTFSLVARCGRTGMFGVAISSSSPAVAARCAFARPGGGAVATQNVTDPALGPRILDRLQTGDSAADALARVAASAAHIEHRQLLVVDAAGRSAARSGAHALGVFATATGADAAAGGNLLAHDGVPAAMLAAFAGATGHLGDRLGAALLAGQDAGGEAGPVHSAGLKIVDRLDWPIVDLRCDWHESDPIGSLDAIWRLYRPQIEIGRAHV